MKKDFRVLTFNTERNLKPKISHLLVEQVERTLGRIVEVCIAMYKSKLLLFENCQLRDLKIGPNRSFRAYHSKVEKSSFIKIWLNSPWRKPLIERTYSEAPRTSLGNIVIDCTNLLSSVP